MNLHLPSATNKTAIGKKGYLSLRVIDIVIIGMMSSLLLAVQVALSFLPNVELVSLLIILFTLVFGRKAIYIIYVFVALEGIVYGIGLWWFNYLYVWTVLFIIALLFKKVHSQLLWAVISGFFGLGFGALCSIPYFLTGGIASGAAYWVAGIPFDILHGIANFAVAFALFDPLYFVLNKINKRIQLIR
jgi:energy-coupling factor transport system substrate-specific component